jgi:hypothetical protein
VFKKHDDSSEFEIVINKDYDISVVVGYSGESGVANSRAKESTTAHICFTPDNLCNGYNSSYKIPIGSGYANVKIEFKRICSFWEVILY